MRLKFLLLAAVSCLLLVSTSGAAAQRKTKKGMIPPSQVETRPANCEFNIAVLTGAHRVAGEDGLVIMIARLGDRESRRDINRRRLHNARTFLTEFLQRGDLSIITAEGESVDGYGRIELYVKGNLFHVLMLNRNDDLAVGACSFEGDDPCSYEREKKLYPCLSRRQRPLNKSRRKSH